MMVSLLLLKKAILRKQSPPGPPPRPGLQWKPQTHRWIRDYEDAREYVGTESPQKVQVEDQEKIRNHKDSVPAFTGRSKITAEIEEHAEATLPVIAELLEDGGETALDVMGSAKRIIESNFPEGIIQQFAEEYNESPERVSAVVNDIVTRIAHQEVAHSNYESWPLSPDPGASVRSPIAPQKLVRGNHYSNYLHD